MHVLLMLAMLLLAVAIIHHLFGRGSPAVQAQGSWGAGAANEDPRVALAAMMVCIVTEDGRMSPQKEQEIIALLTSTVGIDPGIAADCLKAGRRLARLDGDLTSRLHQLKDPIARKCSREEKEGVVEALRKIGGTRSDQIGSVRDGIGRLAATLLHG